jgi:phosphatidylinositol alpha-mannosyltransferase
LGRITDAELASRMRGATVFCAPSLGQESFGVVLLEAMAARAAVVASAIPGYGNVASDGVDALMPPPGDAPALRDALRRVLDDAALRDRLVEAGARRAAEFSLDHLAERFIDVYETAIAVGP